MAIETSVAVGSVRPRLTEAECDTEMMMRKPPSDSDGEALGDIQGRSAV